MAMATIDKIRVREEVDRLKREFEQLCAAGKVVPDTRVVMNSLLVVVELILSIFLERKTHKNCIKGVSLWIFPEVSNTGMGSRRLPCTR
jgi:hypothetical protein